MIRKRKKQQENAFTEAMFEQHIDGVLADLPDADEIERWALIDYLLDYRLANPFLEAQLVVDWALLVVVRDSKEAFSPEYISDKLAEVRIDS